MGRERYLVELECTQCNQLGRLRLSENDQPSFISAPERRVESVEGEFSASTKDGVDVDIVCNKCNHVFIK